jgi:ribonucleotide monophosphatase NagD (HAD superfamily)
VLLPLPRIFAVVVGIDRDISYLKMAKAVLYLRRDPSCKFIATNYDTIVPVNDNLVPSNGMVVAGGRLN